ncbi:DUF1330 domain-containing protein [Pikeienuella piscinae]|uniref:DUF1330 domain-containing protein n=1 Tax=Pikeienuella piscinae TaxID=2748098 RepID=A0A7L5BX23_9RHOB|nr:DUF1330 domain-containing protein [Pikeienuella piscinae]QIE55378.1 DUF1330 domain-containing protein [Pikeienuella piscinae]
MAKGYIIVRVNVTDPEQYAKYRAVSGDAIAAFDGKFIIRAGRSEVIEGEPDGLRLVVIEFPSYEAAVECYHSDVYQAAKKLRDGAGDAQFTVIEGYDP